ncbi:MAG: hypothetical protein ACI4BH_06555 [Muribaculaceae bacterium]
MENDNFVEFDENEAIDYINKALAAKGKSQYGEDDLLLLIDAMYDFYDENDDFDADFDEEANFEPLVAYVTKTIAKDPDNTIKAEDVRDIVLAEIEYESGLN